MSCSQQSLVCAGGGQSRHTAAKDRSLRTLRRKQNRFRNELVRVVEVAGILTMLSQSDLHRMERSVVDDREASALQIG